MPVILYTDALLWLLVLAIGAYAWTCVRRPHVAAPVGRVVGAWLCVAALLVGIGWLTGSLGELDAGLLLTWAVAAPLILALAHLGAGAAMRAFRARWLGIRDAVVVGAGPTAREFAQRLLDSPSSGIRLLGYFDDREPSGDRLAAPAGLAGQPAGLHQAPPGRPCVHGAADRR